jgi:hypothetical protein
VEFSLSLFFYKVTEGTVWRIISRRRKARWVQNSAPEALYLRRYRMYKIGFWNHPEMSHCGIFAIIFFFNVSNPELWRPFTEISKVSVVKISTFES